MKAEELMIGDWVNLTYRDYISGEVVSKDFRVAQIRKYTAEDTGYHLYAERQNMGDVEKISPIPLTPKILEKNFEFLYRSVPGGIYAAAQAVDTYRAEGVTINYVHQYQYAEILNIRYVVFRYVHELQHALKLCGIDKTIEL